MTPLLASVAMVTYNHKPYIAKAIEGILQQQTDFPFELLIGEDCSTDGTRDIVFEYANEYPKRIRVITSQKNVGAHQNALRVERACTGKYVGYCEGDDLWHDPTKLAKQVNFLEIRPEYGMVHCHCHRYVVALDRFEENAYTVPEDLDDEAAYIEMLLNRRCVMTLTILLRRELLHKILDTCPETTDERFLMGDTQRCLEMARLGKIGCIHEALATTNLLPESATQSRNPRKELRFVQSGRALLEHYLSKYPVPADVARQVRTNTARAVLRRAYRAGAHELACSMYEQLKSNADSGSLDVELWKFGSKSVLCQRIAAPLIVVYYLLSKARGKVRNAIRSSGANRRPLLSK